jgi:hypothetical protein
MQAHNSKRAGKTEGEEVLHSFQFTVYSLLLSVFWWIMDLRFVCEIVLMPHQPIADELNKSDKTQTVN